MRMTESHQLISGRDTPSNHPFNDTAGACQKLISALGLTLVGRPDYETKSLIEGL
jgi:hypothetical protein